MYRKWSHDCTIFFFGLIYESLGSLRCILHQVEYYVSTNCQYDINLTLLCISIVLLPLGKVITNTVGVRSINLAILSLPFAPYFFEFIRVKLYSKPIRL